MAKSIKPTLIFVAFASFPIVLIGWAFLYTEGILTPVSALLMLIGVPVFLVIVVMFCFGVGQPYMLWNAKDVRPEQEPDSKE